MKIVLLRNKRPIRTSALQMRASWGFNFKTNHLKYILVIVLILLIHVFAFSQQIKIDECSDPAKWGKANPNKNKQNKIGKVVKTNQLKLPVKEVTTTKVEPPVKTTGQVIRVDKNADYVGYFDIPDSAQTKILFDAFTAPDAINIYNANTNKLIASSGGEIQNKWTYIVPNNVKRIKVEVLATKGYMSYWIKDDGTIDSSGSGYTIAMCYKNQIKEVNTDLYWHGIRLKHNLKTSKIEVENIDSSFFNLQIKEKKMTLKQISKF